MRVTVLGGAAACPNPGQGCSAYLVRTGRETLLLDCGPDTLSVLRQHVDFRSVSAIVVSHLHADHTLDLVPYRYGLRYAPGGTPRRLPLWLPPGGADFLQAVASAFGRDDEGSAGFFDTVFDVREYDPHAALEIGGTRVTFHATRHFVPSWAIGVQADGRTLAYLADTGPSTSWEDFGLGADLAICEGTMLEPAADVPVERQGHLTARQAGELTRRLRARRLLLTHLWAEIGQDRYLAEAEAGFLGPVVVARPGLTVEL